LERLPPPEGRPIKAELGRALGILFGLTFALALIQLALPWTAGGMQVALALILLQLPTWMLRKQGVDERALGLTFGPLWPALGLSLATMAVVFPLFVGGFHLVHAEWRGLPSTWEADRLLRWDESLEHTPPRPCEGGGDVLAWVVGDALWLVSPAEASLDVRVVTAPPGPPLRAVVCPPGRGPEARAFLRADRDGRLTLEPGQGLWVSLADRDDLRLELARDGRPIPSRELRLGAGGAAADADGLIASSRSMWWLLTYVIIHLGLVALPEEWFFRGYLQPRLDQILGTPLRLFGAQVGWGLVLSALFFALLHPILLPGVHRLLVFFPALLFGWLRARSGNVGAAIVVHAMSNVILAVVSRMYG